jgi:hypothetical protein
LACPTSSRSARSENSTAPQILNHKNAHAGALINGSGSRLFCRAQRLTITISHLKTRIRKNGTEIKQRKNPDEDEVIGRQYFHIKASQAFP